jgi:hypothetical protein
MTQLSGWCGLGSVLEARLSSAVWVLLPLALVNVQRPTSNIQRPGIRRPGSLLYLDFICVIRG